MAERRRRPTLDFVNDEIVASHAEIHRIIDAALESLDQLAGDRSRSADELAQLGDLVSELAEQMRMHFQSEERSGFFRLVQQHLPEMNTEVELLRREHGDIHKVLLACLSCTAAPAGPDLTLLAEHLENLRHKLDPHEATEDLLLARLAAVTSKLRSAGPPTAQ